MWFEERVIDDFREAIAAENAEGIRRIAQVLSRRQVDQAIAWMELRACIKASSPLELRSIEEEKRMRFISGNLTSTTCEVPFPHNHMIPTKDLTNAWTMTR